MGTRATTQRSVDPEAVLKRLPPRLRSCVDVGVLGSSAVDLLVFEPGEGHVVTSKELQKALARLSKPRARLVAVGYDFTEEARALVDARGGLLFSERSFCQAATQGGVQESRPLRSVHRICVTLDAVPSEGESKK